MKYSKVEIKPTRFPTAQWLVSFEDIPGDRVKQKDSPHGLGFYYYPTAHGKKKAFDTLKAKIVAEHEAEIARLTASLELLKALNFVEHS
jgi:hypothetical protein